MHGTLRTISVTTIVALLLAAPAAGQQRQGLQFVLGLGYERGDPGPSLVESLDAAGYGDTRSEYAAGTTYYPQAFDEGLHLMFFVGTRYRRGPMSLEVLVSNGSRGHAEGYNALAQRQVLVSWTSVRITPTVGLHLGPLRVAAGPTLDAMFWKGEQNWAKLPSTLKPTIGGTATAGVEVPIAGQQISLMAGARTFPTTDLQEALLLPIEARYDTWFIALSVIPG